MASFVLVPGAGDMAWYWQGYSLFVNHSLTKEILEFVGSALGAATFVFSGGRF